MEITYLKNCNSSIISFPQESRHVLLKPYFDEGTMPRHFSGALISGQFLKQMTNAEQTEQHPKLSDQFDLSKKLHWSP